MPRALWNPRDNEFIDWLRDHDVRRNGDNPEQVIIDEHADGVVDFADVINVFLDDPRIPEWMRNDWINFPDHIVDHPEFRNPDARPLQPPRAPDNRLANDLGLVAGEQIVALAEPGMLFAAANAPNMKKYENGPELWTFLLESIQEVYGCDACIAGGAIRDHFLGVKPKDIDIFIDHNFPDIIEQGAPELNWGGLSRMGKEYEENDTGINGVWECHAKGFKINLIARPIPMAVYAPNLLDTFDFNICKSAFQSGALIDTPVAIVDRTGKTFTYVGPADLEAQKKSLKRYVNVTKRWDRGNYQLGDFKVIGLDEAIEEDRKKVEEEKKKYMEELLKYSKSANIKSFDKEYMKGYFNGTSAFKMWAQK